MNEFFKMVFTGEYLYHQLSTSVLDDGCEGMFFGHVVPHF